MENFQKYITKTTLSLFLVKYEIFKKVLDVQGVIFECGVLFGGGLMTWAKVSEILEPSNHQRRIVGFDTFQGFPEISEKDKSNQSSKFIKKGGLAVDSYEDLQKCVKIFDGDRYAPQYPKVELIRGDIGYTIPNYFKENPHTLVSLMYVDVDIYEGTKSALKDVLPRMPKGAIVAFDELNHPRWPGETVALLETMNINNVKIKKIPGYGTPISYFEV
jgi:hypothetical protein